MATAPDLFAGIIASAALSVSGEEVQAAVVDDMMERIDRDGDLDSQIARSKRERRAAGDFGMELAGAILVPVLIEAAKGLWAAYLKKLGEKAGSKLADLTYEHTAKLLNWLWAGDEQQQVEADFEKLLRKAGDSQGLPMRQVDALVAAVRSPEMKAALQAQPKAKD